jgi:hypothetical protein
VEVTNALDAPPHLCLFRGLPTPGGFYANLVKLTSKERVGASRRNDEQNAFIPTGILTERSVYEWICIYHRICLEVFSGGREGRKELFARGSGIRDAFVRDTFMNQKLPSS